MENRKVALVTGGVRGIGKAISLKLLENGYIVVTNGVSKSTIPSDFKMDIDKLDSKKDDLAHNIHYLQADISLKEDRVKILAFIKDNFQRLDLLVNNAGVAPKNRSDILTTTEESFDRVMGINLRGPFFLTQLLANYMIDCLNHESDNQFCPKIINISSISAYTSSPNRGEYCISKAGLSMMTTLFADRLAQNHIPVFEIRPGIIKTDMTEVVTEKYDKLFEDGLTPIPRWGLPDDVAQAVIAIVNEYFPYSTGQIFDVDGGFHLHRL